MYTASRNTSEGSKDTVNSPDNIIWVLTLFNVLMGVWCIPMAIHIGYSAIFSTQKNIIGPDFIVFYAAAHIVGIAANEIYNLPMYQDIYVTLMPSLSTLKAKIIFPYLYPPALAYTLYPLSFLSFTTAFLAFSAINILLLFILAVQTRYYLRYSPIENYTVFLQSILLCLFCVFDVFREGQTSLILCVLSMAFLLDLQSGKVWRTSLWLALAIHIKPQYFIPILFVFAVQRQWKQLLTLGGIISGIALLSVFICGTTIWESYIHSLFVDHYYTQQVHLRMVNFRGMLEILFGKHAYITLITNLCYVAVCVFAGYYGYFYPCNNAMRPLIIALSLFFSPYMMSHDMLLYLPVGLSCLISLQSFVHKRWVLPCYFMIILMPHITYSFIGDSMQGPALPFYLWNNITGALFVLASVYAVYLQHTVYNRYTS